MGCAGLVIDTVIDNCIVLFRHSLFQIFSMKVVRGFLLTTTLNNKRFVPASSPAVSLTLILNVGNEAVMLGAPGMLLEGKGCGVNIMFPLSAEGTLTSPSRIKPSNPCSHSRVLCTGC
jgi:hypothetical protein